MPGTWRGREGGWRCRLDGGGGCLHALVGLPPTHDHSRGVGVETGALGGRTPRGVGARFGLRRSQGVGVLRQPADALSGVMVVRGGRGSRADEQPRRAGLEDGRAVEKERVRLSQRVGLPIRGANPDGRPDAAFAEKIGTGLPGRIRDRSPLRNLGPDISNAVKGLNGYK